MADSIQRHSFRQRLEAGEQLLGTVITLSDPAVAEIMAQSGFDWIWIDAEHSPLDFAQIQSMAQAAGECPCLVRVPTLDESWAKKTLDIGVEGIIFPLINTPEAAAKAVALTKYPPLGERSVGLGRAQGFGQQFDHYVAQANQWICTAIQVEHIRAVENLEAILAVPGLDAVIIGPYDLSASMGKPGQVDERSVRGAIENVRNSCQSRGIPVGIFTTSSERARKAIRDGFNFVAVGADVMMISGWAVDLVSTLKSG